MPLTIAITNEQKIQVSLNPVTAAGNPATIDTQDGIPTWTVTSGDATAEAAADGMSAWIISGSVGVSTVEVTADADLDATEVRTLADTIAVNVVAAEAAGLGLGAGEPQPK